MERDLNRRRMLGTVGAAVAAGTALKAAAAPADTPAGKKTKIIGICCSPRKGRTTAASLKVCLAAAELPGVQTELIELAGLAIPGQLAAGVPLAAGEKDDFPTLMPKLLDPSVGGIIIGTPVYFGCMSALCKAFLDRCVIFRKKQFALGGKVGGVVAVGGCRNGGQELTIRAVQTCMFGQQMIVVGDGKPTAHWGATVWSGGTKDVTKDEFGMTTAKNLGRHVAQTALRLA